jgi:excisionase family DNA binding protein
MRNPQPPVTSDTPYLTPPQLAKRLGVSPDKVCVWIRRGELRAVNVADRPNGRPRWRIAPLDIATFEARRSAQPEAKSPRRCQKRDTEVTEFF